MARAFVGRFLLPLVEGGALHVGRPIPARGPFPPVALAAASSGPEAQALARLATLRGERGRSYLHDFTPPPLDEASWRIGACVHDLLLLAHPAFVGRLTDLQRIADAALALADLPAPQSPREVVERHTLLERLPEILVPDPTGTWTPLARLPDEVPPSVEEPGQLASAQRGTARLAPGFRNGPTHRSRPWLAEVGVAPGGRRAHEALLKASPLAEALDPFRLEPAWSWARVLPILRFRAIARLVAGRLALDGASRAGAVLARALLVFAAEPEGNGSSQKAESLAFAIRFLAHLLWLDVLAPGSPSAGGQGPSQAGPTSEGELEALLSVARQIDARLVMPPDIPPDGDLAARWTARLRFAKATDAFRMAAEGVCRIAAAEIERGNP